MKNIHKHVDENGNVLILKRINKDRTAYKSFKYPALGCVVKAEKWDPSDKCGGGLHGWAWSFGLGDGAVFDIINDTWLVLAAKPEDVVGNIGGGAKCKCKKAAIHFEGTFHQCFTMLQEGLSQAIQDEKNTETTSSENDGRLAASGDDSVLTASGYCSVLTASGYCSRLTASGHFSSLAASGDGGRLTASGDRSRLTASGHDNTIMSSGLGSVASAGENGSFVLTYHDGLRYRHIVSYVGEDGIKPNTKYCIQNGKLTEYDYALYA
jgi:hypothetical protein